jgi:hypothetical protein
VQYTFKKKVTPPPYELKQEILNSYRESYKLNILIETGTFLGDTVEYCKRKFEKVYSIELSDDLARKAKKRFENDPNVIIIQGDSGKVLKTILKEIKEPVLFWLDGHYSSEFFVGTEFIKTARTEIDTPIEEELTTILDSRLNHVILIDDARLFNGQNDYPKINSIKHKVRKAKGSDYVCKVENDIIHLFPQRIDKK